jgi:hypothetical protein
MKKLTYSRKEIIDVLRTLNEIVVSLDRLGSAAHEMTPRQHDAELTKFIRGHKIFRKVAKARMTLSEPFPSKVGSDGMDELERAMQKISFWEPTTKRRRKV